MTPAAGSRVGLAHWAWLAATVLWLGGLTFYAAIVVPIGAKITSSTTQGFVTQQVTTWLNGLGTAYVVVTVLDATGRAGRVRQVAWYALAALQISLWMLHPVLDRQLDLSTLSVVDSDRFYRWHRIYLIATAVQWFAGVVHVGVTAGRVTRPGR